jgi:hypothetical protein
MPRELVLLSPYTPPTQHALSLAAEDTAAWLNAWTALWHPAVLADAAGPPRWASGHEHDPPLADHVYSVPETPAAFLSDDWDDRVRSAGSIAFRAAAERQETLANLGAALGNGRLEWSTDAVHRLFGLGLAYLVIDTLFEAMEHQRLLDVGAFWADVQAATREPTSAITHLQAAAGKLQAARDSLYPVTINLLDFALVDETSDKLPATVGRRFPINVITTGESLERLAVGPLAVSEGEPLVEICGGTYCDRADELLSIESQLWNLRRGLEITKRLTGLEVQTFASPRGSFHPHTPLLLQQVGLPRAIFQSFGGDSRLPTHKAAVIQWPAADGKQIEAFTRTPLPAEDPNTYFHLAHYLHQTIMQDSAAVFGLLHRPGTVAAPWYDDWLAASELAPVLGTWTTVPRFLGDGVIGDYTSPANADDFAIEALEGRKDRPISVFADHQRLRRRLDAARTYAGLFRGLGGRHDAELHDHLGALENRIERFETVAGSDIDLLEARAAGPLIARLLGWAVDQKPGLLLLNPCAFTRRVTVERDDFTAPPPVNGPVKSVQVNDNMTRLVVEVPALGFAWVSRGGEPADPNSEVRTPKPIRLADQQTLRNEFLEAEIDPATGGLRSIRDSRSRENRLGQQLVYQPGSKVVVEGIQVTSAGPALGEIVSTGRLVDDQDAPLASFRQRFRVWLGRPLLEMRIELHPDQPPQGYPWHAYYGARFAWRDEHASLSRAVVGQASVTTHTRPCTPDFLELRSGSHATVIFPGGLPFHQRHGSRMLDVILVTEGESATTFDIALSLDRDQPMQTAWGFTSPVLAVPVEKGPPHIGPTGWLFHLDAPNLLMTSLTSDPGESPAVAARMLELNGFSGAAELRCPRDPKEAAIVDALGTVQQTLGPSGDTVPFDYGGHDLVTVQVVF